VPSPCEPTLDNLLRQTLCADVEKEQAEAELRRMMPVSISAASSPSSAPDRRHPTTYIICEHIKLFHRPLRSRWQPRQITLNDSR